jgi:hypothetical protein
MATISRRRICWPDPDATCLEGGCIHCNSNRFRYLATIERYAREAGILPNRGIGEKHAEEALTWGIQHGFPGVECR